MKSFFRALSGSGIAYVYMMAEAMADAGVHGGLSRDYATKVAVQTILGAAQMAAQTEKHPAVLKGTKMSQNSRKYGWDKKTSD